MACCDVLRWRLGYAAVVLTTHSMEEADALCQRIGIVINGSLQAVGTAQHLKNKFGFEFEVEGSVITTRISLSDL